MIDRIAGLFAYGEKITRLIAIVVVKRYLRTEYDLRQ